MIEFFERIVLPLRESVQCGRHHRREGKTEAHARLRLVHLDFLYQMAHATDSQTVFSVVLYLGSLRDDDDLTVHYDSPAAVGVEVL